MPHSTQNFSPIDASPFAVETFTFDFMPPSSVPGGYQTMMAVGETIQTAVMQIQSLENVDQSPSSRLIGSPQVVGGTKVLQQIGTCVATEVYWICATVTTSAGQTLSLAGFCPCNKLL
jgi:hypothetical protein